MSERFERFLNYLYVGWILALRVGFCGGFWYEINQSIIMTVKVALMCLSVWYPGHIMSDIPLIYRSLSSHWSPMVRRKWNNRTKSRFCENPTLKWSKGASWETTEIANFGLASRRVTEKRLNFVCRIVR